MPFLHAGHALASNGEPIIIGAAFLAVALGLLIWPRKTSQAVEAGSNHSSRLRRRKSRRHLLAD